MTSIIFQTVARLLEPIILLYAAFLLISGHNEPGGGFCGGLMAGGAFILHVIAFDLRSARRMLIVAPQSLIGAGLLLAVGSGLPSMIAGRSFLTGWWTAFDLPGLGAIKVGTPLLFDAGVFLVVVGVVSLIMTALTEMQQRKEAMRRPPGDGAKGKR